MAFNAIQDAPIDNRRGLYEHIVISGGSTMYPGMSTRMDKEMRQLYLDRVLKARDWGRRQGAAEGVGRAGGRGRTKGRNEGVERRGGTKGPGHVGPGLGGVGGKQGSATRATAM